VSDGHWLGRVLLVAGSGPVLDAVAAAGLAAGAYVAVVSTAFAVPDAHAQVRADPTDPAVWDRVLPHVEQRLGPIDAVVCDAAAARVLAPLVEPDLRRRGHGSVLVPGPADSAAEVLSRLASTP
jgi:NAD(P)-dependent dehydrogenase (short-subunit alcohol dehydrogenase family)